VQSLIARGMRICLSAGSIVLLLAAASRLRHVNSTTVALVLVLSVLGIALEWGWLEALVASVVAAFGLDYYFLPPYGIGIEAPEHWVAFFAFLVTAITTGLLSARAKRHLAEAVRHRADVEKLNCLSDALAECESEDAILERLGGSLRAVLGIEAVASYNKASGRTLRSGSEAAQIADEQLRRVEAGGSGFSDAKSGLFLMGVREGSELAGSIGIAGKGVSPLVLKAIAEKVRNALARTRASQKVIEAEIARRSEELRSAVFDALAHEARGPLGSINLAATTLLSERPGDAAQQREMLTIIKEEVERISQWIDEASRMSQLEASQFKLNKAPQDVTALVCGAIEELGPRLAGRPTGVEIPDMLPMAVCDGEMVQHVLKLLLDNAIKYSPPGSPITISSRQDNGAIVITVSDAGPGVPEDEQERIFEKNYRGVFSSGIPGTGLGLAGARHLVESQGGKIWVTSRPQGGAAFHFSLPLAKGVAV
jgi:two-component system, OmpR family, sensor histidine kinase KdpD